MGTCDEDVCGFHSQDFKISVSTDGVVVETVVWIC